MVAVKVPESSPQLFKSMGHTHPSALAAKRTPGKAEERSDDARA